MELLARSLGCLFETKRRLVGEKRARHQASLDRRPPLVARCFGSDRTTGSCGWDPREGRRERDQGNRIRFRLPELTTDVVGEFICSELDLI